MHSGCGGPVSRVRHGTAPPQSLPKDAVGHLGRCTCSLQLVLPKRAWPEGCQSSSAPRHGSGLESFMLCHGTAGIGYNLAQWYVTPGHLTETECLALKMHPLPLPATECLLDPGKCKEVLRDEYLTSFLGRMPGPGLEDPSSAGPALCGLGERGLTDLSLWSTLERARQQPACVPLLASIAK